jgi:DNA gyrase subunit A
MGRICHRTKGVYVDGEPLGGVVGALVVRGTDRVMLVTDTGRAIQIPVSGISVIGRITKGVRLMRVAENERIVSVARMIEADATEFGGEVLSDSEEAAGEGAEEAAGEGAEEAAGEGAGEGAEEAAGEAAGEGAEEAAAAENDET